MTTTTTTAATTQSTTIRQAIDHIESRLFNSLAGQHALPFHAHALVTFRRMGHWEFAASFVTLCYGLFLILPLDTLTIIGLSDGHNLFLRTAAESLWGVAFLVAGLNQWIGAWISWTHWRILNGLIIAIIWSGIAWLYFGIYPGSTAGFLASMMMWCALCGLVTLTKTVIG